MKALQEPPQPEEKQPAAPKKFAKEKGNHEASTDDVEIISEPAEEEIYIPTAMEFALRKAMEKSKDERKSEQKRLGKLKKNNKHEEIFSRTLESRIHK